MADRVRMAVVQMEPILLQKERNLSHALDAAETAARQGARLIVFPECALTGYCFTSLDEARPVAEPVPGPSSKALAAFSRRTGAHLVVGLIEEADGHCFNAAVLARPDGAVVSYRKVHLPYLGIDRFLTHGDRPFAVHDTGWGRLGLHICYDATFPESGRVMTLEGADVIALPTNWPPGREIVPQCVLPTRALENHVYYLAADRVGVERGVRFIGRSRILDFTGAVLAEAGPTEETILYADIEPAKARETHRVYIPGEHENDVIADRRPEFYGAVVRRRETVGPLVAETAPLRSRTRHA